MFNIKSRFQKKLHSYAEVTEEFLQIYGQLNKLHNLQCILTGIFDPT